MKAKLSLTTTKIIRKALRLVGRGGSLPGSIALKLDPDILKKLKYPNKVILVTGTNGKTTTTNMIYQLMQQKYERVICNVRGDNLMPGIATLAIGATNHNGKVETDCMVIEVDELNVPHVLKNVKVDTVVVHNFFRDQLDRAGEMETIVNKVEKAIKDFHGDLVLNGDDPNVARLAQSCQGDVYYSGVSKNALSRLQSGEASEGKFCYRCNHELVYSYYQYSHIGRFKCPNCGFGDYQLYKEAKDVDCNNYTFNVDKQLFKAPQDALYSIYNCMALISVAALEKIDLKNVASMLEHFELKDGRMETFDIGKPCLLNLVKNPTGANEVMKYIMRDQEDKDILIVLNDNDQDGTDISWIWDADFDLIIEEHTRNIICSGTRAYDMALRLKYSGYEANIKVLEDYDAAVKYLKGLDNHAYVISTYTALQAMRAVLRRNK